LLGIQTISIIFYFTLKNKNIKLLFVSLFIFFGIFYLTFFNNFLQINFKEIAPFRIYTIFETILLSSFFFLVFQKKIKIFLLSVVIPFLLYALYDLKNSELNQFDSASTAIESLIFITFSIFYFYERISIMEGYVYDSPYFWVVFGIIIYFSANFFGFIVARDSFKQVSFEQNFKLILGISSIIQNILFFIAFIVAKQQYVPAKKTSLSTKKPQLKFKP
jgi:hypothetical protein